MPGSHQAELQSLRSVPDCEDEAGCYIGGDFEITDDHRAGKIAVNLAGSLNTCGVTGPSFDV